MTFAQIKARVESYLIDVPTATAAEVGGWVNQAIRTAEERHNFRIQESSIQFVTVLGQRTLGTKPSDWKESRMAPWLLDGDSETREIFWSTESDVIRSFSDSSLDVEIGRAHV